MAGKYLIKAIKFGVIKRMGKENVSKALLSL